jgi:hypothetical protein
MTYGLPALILWLLLSRLATSTLASGHPAAAVGTMLALLVAPIVLLGEAVMPKTP